MRLHVSDEALHYRSHGNFTIKINNSDSAPPLPFRAFTKVLKDIAQQDSITKKGLLKAKPFTAYFEDNAINSVTRKLDYHTA